MATTFPAPILVQRGTTTYLRRSVPFATMMALTAILLLVGVFTAPNNHDESQYVAGAALVRSGLIYRDFASLQPPLQTWLYAPLAALFPGQTLLAMRLMTALFGLSTAVAIYGAQRLLHVNRRSAALATLAMACCASFLFTGSVVRNDMLPAALASAATALLLHAAALGRARIMILAGMLLGAATSAKLSYAPMLACAAVAPLLAGKRAGLSQLLCFAAGAGLGLLPMLTAAALAPWSFIYGVFTYAQTAPFDWYAVSGRGHELNPVVKFLQLVLNMAQGPALLALVLGAGTVLRQHDRLRPEHVMLAALILGGWIGAALPTPTQIQYLLPMLPPLFVAFGLIVDRGLLERRLPRILLALFAVAGVSPTVIDAAAAIRSAPPVLVIQSQARAIGSLLSEAGARGPIATVAPERAIDSGYPIDPRFATGPFLFRNDRLMPAALVRSLNTVTPRTLELLFHEAPPAAILVGYEKWRRNGEPPADAPLETFALRHGFERILLADGIGRLYIAPGGPSRKGR